MGRPELFSYLSAFVTIVLAVAISDMVQSTHRLIRNRKFVTWDARPLAFAAIVSLALVSEFFSLWSRMAVDHVTMGRLLWLLATPALFALLAYSALPDECPQEGLNLTEFFRTERGPWVILFGTISILDFARGAEETLMRGWPFGPFIGHSVLLYGPLFVALAIIYFANRRLWSWIGLTMLGAVMAWGVSGWTIRAGTGP